MGYGYKWTPSKKAAKEFAQKMDEISGYCATNGIGCSSNMDSFYFFISGQEYRVSNHSIEASNARARNFMGTQVREKYHPDKGEHDVIYIHASKTRLIDIHMDLLAGRKLDGRGNRVLDSNAEIG